MNTTIRKIGNSEGIIIPKEMLDQFGLKSGDSVEISAGKSGLFLKVPDEDFARQVANAERFMEKYKVALKKLAE